MVFRRTGERAEGVGVLCDGDGSGSGDERLQDRVVPDEGGWHTGFGGDRGGAAAGAVECAGARAVLKGAATLEGPWEEVDVSVGGGLGEAALPMRFFKVEVVLP